MNIDALIITFPIKLKTFPGANVINLFLVLIYSTDTGTFNIHSVCDYLRIF
jgi:hypothetical protein